MAILKSTKKIAASPERSRKTKEANVVKSIDDLKLELISKQADLIEAKRGHRQGELVNPCVLRTTRKQIARLHTAIRLDKINTAFAGQRRRDK